MRINHQQITQGTLETPDLNHPGALLQPQLGAPSPVRPTLLTLGILALPLLALSGCLNETVISSKTANSSASTSDSTSTTSATTQAAATTTTTTSTSVPSGARAVKIIFKQSSSSGSFDSAPSTGTINNPGNGHQAQRVFNADGSLLASGGPTSSNWPKWFSGFEIGISGTSNAGAKNSDCARFAATGESADTECQYDDAGNGSPTAGVFTDCGGPDGYLRVSEYDCTKSSSIALQGNGGPTDGVYLRATFNRSSTYLGSSENILVVLEYAASSLNNAASDPSNCFQSGTFTPTREGCADQLWQIFMKHTAYEVVQPYLMLAPPSTHVVDRKNGHFGGSAGSKQFILPLSGDSDLSVLQVSRIRGPKNLETPTSTGATESTDAFTMFCAKSGDPGESANSAGCVGMVFYSMTFIRM